MRPKKVVFFFFLFGGGGVKVQPINPEGPVDCRVYRTRIPRETNPEAGK